MNAIPLFTKDGLNTNISYCSLCKLPHLHDVAENCCKKGICKHCGGETATVFNEKCFDCLEKNHLEKAEKLESWDGPVVFNDHYYETIADMLDCEDTEDLPEFVYIAETVNIPKLDAEDILERLCEDLYEDAYDNLNGVDEFIQAVNDFNKVNEGNTYLIESDKRAVRVPRPSRGIKKRKKKR